MHCPKCGSVKRVKAGFIKDTQRYKCKDCCCQYTRSDPKGFPLRVRLMAILLYTHGVSLSSIAKLVGASSPAVLKWIRQFTKEHSEVPVQGESRIVKLDEMDDHIKTTARSRFRKPWVVIADDLSSKEASSLIAIHHERPEDE